jgi:adenosine 3'-phospho 5'-phosphosulfate transporter B3
MAIEVPSTLSSAAAASLSDDYDEHEPLKINNQPTSPISPSARQAAKHFVTINKNILPILGLFVFYIGHDALQERMFRFVDFKYGFYMTLVEVVIMLIGSTLDSCKSNSSSKCSVKTKMTISMETLLQISIVGILLALAHGLGNTALRYSSYPLKVAFKSCKLVPTMAFGVCVTGRKHTALQYIAALIMGMGLAVLTAADVFHPKSKLQLVKAEDYSLSMGPLLGPILLGISTILDSVVPNLQEQLLQRAKVNTSDLIFFSNAIMCLFLAAYTTYSGELVAAWIYCIQHFDALGILLCQGICAYFGLQCYLSIVRDHGGVAGVLFANARKVCTILLSFLLFTKPFNVRHFLGLVLVFFGVYLGYKGKAKKLGAKERKGKGSNKCHDHSV